MESDMTFKENLIVKGNIFGKNGKKFNLEVKGNLEGHNLTCLDLKCHNLDCLDLECENLDCMNLSYFAVAIAYKSFKCNSVKGKRKNSKHFCLDSEIEITGEKNE